jgi:hypothetical protein
MITWRLRLERFDSMGDVGAGDAPFTVRVDGTGRFADEPGRIDAVQL